MTETTVINITTIQHVKELPKCELRCYSLTGNETIETAIDKFENYYRVAPQRGWVWDCYLYLEVK